MMKVSKREPKDFKGAIFKASQHKDVDALKYWLSQPHDKEDLNAYTNGITALMECARCGFEEGLALLLAHGADAKCANDHGLTALMWSVWVPFGKGTRSSACARSLIEHSDVQAVEKGGKNALHIAAQNGNSALVSVLLPHIGVEAQCALGANALMSACQSGNQECVWVLLEHMSMEQILNTVDNIGQSALDYAKQADGNSGAAMIDYVTRYVQMRQDKEDLERQLSGGVGEHCGMSAGGAKRMGL